MPIIKHKVDEKLYFNCNMFYLRRYIGVREISIISALFVIGIVLLVLYNLLIVLIMAFVTLALFIFAIVLFLITGKAGYKSDIVKNGIAEQQFEFGEKELIVTNLDAYGAPIFKETHPYEKLDRVAIRRDKVYVYAQVSVFYYITTDALKDINLSVFCDFLHEHIPPQKFKVKTTYRIWPKRRKVTLTPGEGKQEDRDNLSK